MYQNRATLIGFLGRDAEVKSTQNNVQLVLLSLATKRRWKDKDTGERFSETTWHRCIVWGQLCEFAATLTKGAHLLIEGDIRTREFTSQPAGKKSAIKRSITEIRVSLINKLDRPPKGEVEEAN